MRTPIRAAASTQLPATNARKLPHCVEVAVLSGERIDVRDSKNPRGALLQFTSSEWKAFVAGVRADRFGG